MNCPECDAVLKIPNDAVEGEIVSCSDCGSEFEISKNDEGHIEVKRAENIGEDWGE